MAKKVMKTTAPRKRRAAETYKRYISKVLKLVHPQTKISKKGMDVLNSFCVDAFNEIASEAGRLCKLSKQNTISNRDVQAATRLVLPSVLSKHAVSEATKAMTKFQEA